MAAASGSAVRCDGGCEERAVGGRRCAWQTVEETAQQKPTKANSTSVLVVMATPSTTGSTASRRGKERRSCSSSHEKRMVNIGPKVLMV